MAVIAIGEVRPGVIFATGGGGTITAHIDDPLPQHVTLALSDHDGNRVLVVPQALLDGLIAAYQDRGA